MIHKERKRAWLQRQEQKLRAYNLHTLPSLSLFLNTHYNMHVYAYLCLRKQPFFFFFYFKMKSLQGCWNFCANTGLRYPATTENGNKTQYKSIPLDYYWDMIVNI